MGETSAELLHVSLTLCPLKNSRLILKTRPLQYQSLNRKDSQAARTDSFSQFTDDSQFQIVCYPEQCSKHRFVVRCFKAF